MEGRSDNPGLGLDVLMTLWITSLPLMDISWGLLSHRLTSLHKSSTRLAIMLVLNNALPWLLNINRIWIINIIFFILVGITLTLCDITVVLYNSHTWSYMPHRWTHDP